jgi:aminocarboxymuconate-semialdehyde decarboxylase
MMPTRREFLAGLSKAAAGVCFVGCGCVDAAARFKLTALQAAASSGAGKRRKVFVGGQRVITVDLHAHVHVPEVYDLIKDRLRKEGSPNDIGQGMGLADPVRSAKNSTDHVELRLADMDEMGIDIQAVSINPFWYWADPELARKLIRIQNEKIAELCAGHPDRFVGLGTVALQHPDLSVEQMDEGVKMGMRGFAISGSVNGKELSDPMFHPFWKKAEELQTLIFIHPQGLSNLGDYPTPEQEPRFQGNGRLGNVIGQPLETTLALTHLIQDGTLDLFPDVKICAAHGGGYLPFYSGRGDQCLNAFPKDCKPLKKTPSEYLKKIYYDSIVFTPEDMRHLIAVVGYTQVVIGTDYETLWNRHPVDRVLEVPGLNDGQQTAILGGNAHKVLKIKV